jgi:predicted NACHT family NTPase
MNSIQTNSEVPRFGRMGPMYPWRRYWVPRDGLIDLSDDGFLVDPESERARYSAQKLYTLPELQHYRALVLLGEPGIGKSITLGAEYDTPQQPMCSEQQLVRRYVDLRSFSSDVLLHSRVFGSSDFLTWQAGNTNLVLYLDSLDEALLRIDTVAAFLADELHQHPTARLSVRIACRTFVWPHEPLETAFARICGEEAVGVFELAPLRRRDVADAAAQRGINANRFIEEVQKANAVPFAIKPLTLNLLFRLYERDGSLPNRQVDLYAQGCLSLCEEHSPNRRGAGRLGQLNSHQRYRLAGRIAAVTMLANRYAVWTDPIDAAPGEDVALAALETGRETGDFQPFDATETNLREVLDTGLFSSRGAGRTGWAHQSYAEFLAADYLVTKHTTPENILKTLCHPSGGLIPQLWMVAAWVASQSSELRQVLIAQEPFTLLRGDLFSWIAEDVAALTDALLAAFQDQRAHDFAWGLRMNTANSHILGSPASSALILLAQPDM